MLLRNAAVWQDGHLETRDVAVGAGKVLTPESLPAGAPVIDLEGRVLLPGLVNGHDHLDGSTFPELGSPPYPSAYAWAEDIDRRGSDPALRAGLAVPLADRLLLGGIRNLLAGVTAVAHHNPWHRSLARAEFPVHVLERYDFAHSPGFTPHLRKTYRTTDRRIPWFVHVAEGTDARCRGELAALVEANVLRQNTVIVHGIGLAPEDAPGLHAAEACVVWCPEANQRLYGATAPVPALRAAGVRVGLGSDSPATGVRDALSNLAAARATGFFSDLELVRLATRETAEVARLPVGGCSVGEPADFVATPSPERLLSGDRTAVALVVVGGEACYGEPALMAGTRSSACTVDGAPRMCDAGLARRVRSVLKAHPSIRGLRWLTGLDFTD